MHAAPVDFPDIKRNLWVVPVAVVMGIALGLFVNGYWLASLFPPSSRQLLLLTAAITLVGAALYWLSATWAAGRLLALPRKTRFIAILAALAAGILLFF